METTAITCPYCAKGYKNKGGCSNHIRSAHPAEYVLQLTFMQWIYAQRVEYLRGQITCLKNNTPADPRYEEVLAKYRPRQKLGKIAVPALDGTEVEMDVDEGMYNDENWDTFEYRNFLTFAIDKCKSEAGVLTSLAPPSMAAMVDKCIQFMIEGYNRDKASVHWRGFSKISKMWFIQRVEGSVEGLLARQEEGKKRIQEVNQLLELANAGWACLYCGEKNKSSVGLSTHKQQVHPEEFWKEEKNAWDKETNRLQDDFKRKLATLEQIQSGGFMDRGDEIKDLKRRLQNLLPERGLQFQAQRLLHQFNALAKGKVDASKVPAMVEIHGKLLEISEELSQLGAIFVQGIDRVQEVLRTWTRRDS